MKARALYTRFPHIWGINKPMDFFEGSTDDLILLQISSGGVWRSRDLQLSCNVLYLLSPRLCFFIVLNRDLLVDRDDLLTS